MTQVRTSPSGKLLEVGVSSVPAADLPTTVGQSGDLISVRENLGVYQCIDGSPLTPDGAQIVNAPGCQWQRIKVAAPRWMAQDNWAVDETNGDDYAPGTNAAPLKTFAELEARTFGGFWTPQAVTIEPRGDFGDIDNAWNNINWEGMRGTVSVTCPASYRTTIATGTITAVQAQDAANNLALQITDSGANFATTTRGLILELTSGPNAGAVMAIGARISSTVLRCSMASMPDAVIDDVTPPAIVPQVGDTYKIEAYPRLGIRGITLGPSYHGAFLGGGLGFFRANVIPPTTGESSRSGLVINSARDVYFGVCRMEAIKGGPSIVRQSAVIQSTYTGLCRFIASSLSAASSSGTCSFGPSDFAREEAENLWAFSSSLIANRTILNAPALMQDTGLFVTNAATPALTINKGPLSLLGSLGGPSLWGSGAGAGGAVAVALAPGVMVTIPAGGALPTLLGGAGGLATIGNTSVPGTWQDVFDNGFDVLVGAGFVDV